MMHADGPMYNILFFTIFNLVMIFMLFFLGGGGEKKKKNRKLKGVANHYK